MSGGLIGGAEASGAEASGIEASGIEASGAGGGARGEGEAATGRGSLTAGRDGAEAAARAKLAVAETLAGAGDAAAARATLGVAATLTASAESGSGGVSTRTLTLTAGAERPGSAGAAADDPLIGQYLAHFLIEQRIGRGGMGAVYRATDIALDRPVAVKVLAAQVADNPVRVERFYREARAQARIQHPNVAHIYFVGEDRGRLFYAMEYIVGESLAERLERVGALPLADAVEMCRMAARGLRAAQAHGFTHRDIKPSNLMVDGNGTLKVVDFGLVTAGAEARTAGAAEAAVGAGGGRMPSSFGSAGSGSFGSSGSGSSGSSGPSGSSGSGSSGSHPRLTATAGNLLGTPLYMAPEQARGDEVDFRTDVYALGVTLHQLVTGAPPFAGDDVATLLRKHRSEARPRAGTSRSQRRRLASFDRVCDRMMAKRPSDRYDSYEALIADLDQLNPARARAAGLWARSAAFGIDLALVGLMRGALEFVVQPREDFGVMGLLVLVYFAGCHGLWGRTLGKAALELEVVVAGEGGPARGIGLSRALWRWAIQWAPLYVIGAAQTLWTLGGGGESSEPVFGMLFGLGVLRLPVESALAAGIDPNKRTSWDRLTHSRVRYRRPG